MKDLLKGEMDDFLAAHEQPARKAFHVNMAKTSMETVAQWLLADSSVDAVQLSDANAFCYSMEEGRSIGSLVQHHAGMIYSQDPAAMLPLLQLPITPDLRILDLCAAPGGKSSQLAMAVDGGSGFLLANEPNASRNRILLGNMERMGYRNVMISCLQPEEISALYPEYFDLVVVDAPCSGEGMFRKYPESVEQWSEENVCLCAQRQRTILQEAVRCLKPGGRLVYSTCTYAPEENEEQVLYLNSLGLIPSQAPQVVSKLALQTMPSAFRCYPHRYEGEGQFMTYLEKPGIAGEEALVVKNDTRDAKLSGVSELSAKQRSLLADCLGGESERFPFLLYRDRVILLPFHPVRLPQRGLTCLGVTVAQWDEKKKRYTPHHQFFSAYGRELNRKVDLSFSDPALRQYLCGMELADPSAFSKGYGAILCDGVPIGGFRAAGGRLKNLYPKGLRETHL